MSKVFDCFLYCNEPDVLEIRLNELDLVVDRFVLCEARRTFTNEPKSLNFLKSQERFAAFLPKIIHVIVDDFPADLISPRELKHFQRNALARGLVDCVPDDVVIVSDVGEIPNPAAIRAFGGPISGLQMRRFYCYLNLEDIGSQSNTVRSAMCRFEYLRSPQWLRAVGNVNNVLNRIVEDGGWHFSHLGDTNWLSYSQDSNWEFVPIDASYPAYVVRHQPEYERLIGQARRPTRAPAATPSSIYYELERPEVLTMVPHDARRVLELGCASGKVAAALKRRQECHVTGVEYCAEPAAQASTRLDRVIVGDCESIDLEALFQPGEFDCLIAADVLEHLRDPESLLRRLQPFLTTDASIVVSLPNVRHAGVLKAAVQGYWSYQPWGILDRTHLRFFTRREIDNMFIRLGFEVEERNTIDEPVLVEWEQLGRPVSLAFGAMTLNGLDEHEIREFFVIQWLARARSVVRPRGSVRLPAPGEMGGSLEVDALPLDGMVPHITVAKNEIEELTSKLSRERQHSETVQAELVCREEQLVHSVSELEARQAELTRRNEELANKTREAESWHRQLVQRSEEHELLAAGYEHLLGERDVFARELAAMIGSTSWRVTAPLRELTRRRPAFGAPVRSILRGHPTSRRVLRRAKRLMWLTVTLQLPGRIAGRLRARRTADAELTVLATGTPAVQEVPAISAVYSAHPIPGNDGPDPLAPGKGRRLICMTHVLPYPSRAGNEYRIHHMLTWLAAQGWDVLLLVYPLPDEQITSGQVTEAAAQYPNLIICEPDGKLLYRLRDGGAMLEGLRGRQPRSFAPLLNEGEDTRPGAAYLLSMMQRICPDVLIELLLHVEGEFQPAALLAEYVFMTRPFAILRPGLLKVVDTIDVFSTKQAKVAQYGVDDGFALTQDLESELLNRADVLIAIQGAEANDLRKLAPRRRVISVGVDFSLVEQVPPPASRPVILLVGSRNALNVKGLNDFLRFAWPLVRNAVPEAELHVIGAVGNAVDTALPGIRILGKVQDLAAAYADARVVINPAIAGTGLKIKTVEALCHLRPLVLWPAGVDGLAPELRALCRIATNWYDFARHVVDLASRPDAAQSVIDRRPELARQFAPQTVYAPLGAALASK
ncbi:MAG: methyltransferase domain-containing protein [Chloroflexota bacterium]|nr:methyltransferase domain-containing protein [Chloroflexota bacterium]